MLPSGATDFRSTVAKRYINEYNDDDTTTTDVRQSDSAPGNAQEQLPGTQALTITVDAKGDASDDETRKEDESELQAFP